MITNTQTKPVSHTPTPWEMHGCAVYQADIWKDGRNIGGEFVFGIRDEDTPDDERLANARFAVRAVNSHAALVEACRSALSVLESMLLTIQRDWPDVYSPSSVRTSIDKCLAALKAARGEDQL